VTKKTVALFSGGLDSCLTVKLMLEQGIEVVALHFDVEHFLSPDIDPDREGPAEAMAKSLGATFRKEKLGSEYIHMLMNPKFGYGKAINPCIDCHIYMIKKAKEIMEQMGASFIVTGEVLGQRPMSQRKDALNIVDRETGTKGILLRPLSALCFEATEPEKTGIVDREKLLGIQGRTRKGQMELARKVGLDSYPSPGGGCMLTDANYARRIRHLFSRKEIPGVLDFKILRLGRAIKLSEKAGAVIGRDEKENETLEGYREFADAFVVPVSFKGPSAAILGEFDESAIRDVGRMILHYGKKPEGNAVLQSVFHGKTTEFEVESSFPEDELKARMI
jgi:tRNA-uridine 2-sulfurtransferase